MRYFLDGYKVAYPDKLPEARKYLEKLCDRVMFNFNIGADKIPLYQVATEPFGISVLISYTHDGEIPAKLLANYLRDMGVTVYFWAEKAGEYLSKSLYDVMDEWVDESDVVIYFISRGTIKSKGQKYEARRAKFLGKVVAPLIDEAIPEDERHAIKYTLRHLTENAIWKTYRLDNYHEVIKAVGNLVDKIKTDIYG